MKLQPASDKEIVELMKVKEIAELMKVEAREWEYPLTPCYCLTCHKPLRAGAIDWWAIRPRKMRYCPDCDQLFIYKRGKA